MLISVKTSLISLGKSSLFRTSPRPRKWLDHNICNWEVSRVSNLIGTANLLFRCWNVSRNFSESIAGVKSPGSFIGLTINHP